MSKARDPQTTSRIMSAIKSKDTKPELLLRKALWKENIRYRINYKKIPGKPDIAITKYKIAIFCDGDFWHGHNWAIRGMKSLEEELDKYSDYWKNKILRNIERDDIVNKELNMLGWRALRFWESDIERDLAGCVLTVKQALFEEMINSDEEVEEASFQEL